MDLSFINVPTTHPELLGLLRIAYHAGQNSVDAKIKTEHGDIIIAVATPIKKYTFTAWLSRLAQQWSNAEE